MRYESTTPRGNTGVSYDSQAAADDQAAKMDSASCTGCTECTGCEYCTRCTGCEYCTDCTGCASCASCENCTRCTGCENCASCTRCENCTECTECTGCEYCTGCAGWRGPKASKLVSLNGLRWPVATDGANIQIGCQQHPVSKWSAFDDDAIRAMSYGAVSFWAQWQSVILAIAEKRAARHD